MSKSLTEAYAAMYLSSILGYMEQVKELDDPVGKHLC
jgi:hypothetical protein